MSVKEKLQSKRKCLCICNVWRMSTLFHAFAWPFCDRWFGTYASQTFDVLLSFGCQSQKCQINKLCFSERVRTCHYY